MKHITYWFNTKVNICTVFSFNESLRSIRCFLTGAGSEKNVLLLRSSCTTETLFTFVTLSLCTPPLSLVLTGDDLFVWFVYFFLVDMPTWLFLVRMSLTEYSVWTNRTWHVCLSYFVLLCGNFNFSTVILKVFIGSTSKHHPFRV